jgi:spermidine synthase
MVWTDMATVIPEGQKGVAQIEHFTITEADSERTRTRSVISRDPEVFVPPGTYAKLVINGGVMMSDTQMERRSNSMLIRNAKGHVLIAGLGIGMVIVPLLEKEGVTKVTVLEKSQDVIDLVEGPLRAYLGEKSKRLEVIQADVFGYTPENGVKYDTIYFDIWPDITLDNLKEMEVLHRKYARRKVNAGSWMDSWQKDLLKYRKSLKNKQSALRANYFFG